MKFWVVLILIFSANLAVYAEENFNREILERLVRMETKIDNQQRQIDDIKSDFGDLKADFKDLRADFKDLRADTDKKFDRLYAFLYWAFGIITSLLFVFSSFIL